MMTKKDFKQFADAFARVEDGEDRDSLIRNCIPIFHSNNPKFDEVKFQEWINRRIKGESTKGLG